MALKITDMKAGNFVKTYIAVPEDKIPYKCPYSMWPTHITFHNTANDASTQNEIAYMHRNYNQVSFHIAVDNKEARQGVPFRANAWHCGDGGSGTGNRRSIGVEICYSKSGGERYYRSVRNAAAVISWLMDNYAIPIERVVPHQYWSGKWCPHRMLSEGGTDAFIGLIKAQKITKATDAINRLAQIGAINSPDYWKANYKKVKYLDKLLVNCVKLFSVYDPFHHAEGAVPLPQGAGASGGTAQAVQVAEAINTLVDVGAITTPAYWRSHWKDVKYLPDLLVKLGACR